jgi:hypothetical protein
MGAAPLRKHFIIVTTMDHAVKQQMAGFGAAVLAGKSGRIRRSIVIAFFAR